MSIGNEYDGGMRITIEPTTEHLALDTHPASLTLLTKVVGQRTLDGYEPDEWGVWVTWEALRGALGDTERAAIGLAHAIADIETVGGVPYEVAPVARDAAVWALGGV